MRAVPLPIDGAWLFEPTTFADDRGTFTVPFQAAAFAGALGYDLPVAQVNHSVSQAGVIRGVHFADVPPGQAKYLHVAAGAIRDVVVDIRVGSPTFGRHTVVDLDAAAPRAVFLAEGLGHAFQALTDGTVVGYLCSTPYDPSREHGIHPLDPELALPWRDDLAPVLSPKDTVAPGLADAVDQGLLPTHRACAEHYTRLRAGSPRHAAGAGG
ncbi:dTDP-4-dehydrorhamnose 3,5-epimerase [Pseudonocardia nematodicida]|uniref:dTDP-4-dehydrorhamnose 3,5-epimerase n=1 Tax=Pseudonocardia nematodicida TaxID=1206997 RepID=A0ABV1K504_9PSEU